MGADKDGPVRPVGDHEVLGRVVGRSRSGDGPASSGAVPMRAWAAARRARSHRDGGPPAPPAWASRSVVEDGGVTHELVSELHPLVLVRVHGGGIGFSAQAEVSVSVVDRQRGRGWLRQSPRIQVEGGSYPLAEARLLVQAVQALIDQVR